MTKTQEFDCIFDENLSKALSEIYELCNDNFKQYILKKIPNISYNLNYKAPEIRKNKEWELIYLLILDIPVTQKMSEIWKNALKKSNLSRK